MGADLYVKESQHTQAKEILEQFRPQEAENEANQPDPLYNKERRKKPLWIMATIWAAFLVVSILISTFSIIKEIFQ